MNNFSKLGILFGIAVAFSGYYRYFITWYDPSVAFIIIGIGLSFAFSCWVYHKTRENRESINGLKVNQTAIGDYFQDQWANKEKRKEKELKSGESAIEEKMKALAEKADEEAK